MIHAWNKQSAPGMTICISLLSILICILSVLDIPHTGEAAVFIPTEKLTLSPRIMMECFFRKRGWALASTSRRNENQSAVSLAEEQQSKQIAWRDATILSSQRACLSGKSRLVRVQLDNDATLQEYQMPGQFVQFRYKNNDPIFLAMSSPPGSPYLEFLIKMSPRLPWLNEALVDGQSFIQVSPITGEGFPLQKLIAPTSSNIANDTDSNSIDKSDLLLMAAAGSGIAPLKACIESRKLVNIASPRVAKLYYGEWTEEDLCFTDLFAKWEQDFGVQVIPVLSRIDNSSSRVYVQQRMQQDGILSTTNTAAILCGMDDMVVSATSILEQAGVSRTRILLNL
jgi:NAD(P)H-flavin reductase